MSQCCHDTVARGKRCLRESTTGFGGVRYCAQHEKIARHAAMIAANDTRRTKTEPMTLLKHNYSRPEQEPEPFGPDDVKYLLQHLDNEIRVLEGSRAGPWGTRNYLHHDESTRLNRARLLRAIVLGEWPGTGGVPSLAAAVSALRSYVRKEADEKGIDATVEVARTLSEAENALAELGRPHVYMNLGARYAGLALERAAFRTDEPPEWLPDGTVNPGQPGGFVLRMSADRSRPGNEGIPQRAQLRGVPPRVGERLLHRGSHWNVTSVTHAYTEDGRPNGAIVHAELT